MKMTFLLSVCHRLSLKKRSAKAKCHDAPFFHFLSHDPLAIPEDMIDFPGVHFAQQIEDAPDGPGLLRADSRILSNAFFRFVQFGTVLSIFCFIIWVYNDFITSRSFRLDPSIHAFCCWRNRQI